MSLFSQNEPAEEKPISAQMFVTQSHVMSHTVTACEQSFYVEQSVHLQYFS